MKWWQFYSDSGDGTGVYLRFKTEEEAHAARELKEKSKWFQCDGDGSPVQEVDTDGKWFFTTLEKLKSDS